MSVAFMRLRTYEDDPSKPIVDVVVDRVSEKTRIPREVVSTFAAISNPENKHVFSLAAVSKAFSHVKLFKLRALRH